MIWRVVTILFMIFEACSFVSPNKLTVITMKNGDEDLSIIAKKKGELSGFDIDIAKIIANALGVELVVKNICETYDEVIEMVANGAGDIGLSNLSYTNKRRNKVLFSNEYIKSKRVLLINNISYTTKMDNKTLKEAIDRKDIMVGVVDESSYVGDAMEFFPRAKIVKVKNFGEIMRMLARQELDLSIYDELSVKVAFFKNREDLIRIRQVILNHKDDAICVAVNPKNKDLLDHINDILRHMPDELNVDKIIEKYRGAIG